MGEVGQASEEFLQSTRFWIQRVFVPILVTIGVGGNTLTVMVLTRKRMRCSTTIYLTALAVADIIYLLFVLTLSFKVYDNINDRKYELYWRFFGLIHWLVDAASSASVWLTVSFTLERYIAVCHPIRGKVLCTENRAKSIIVIVSILCILTTASTTFEHELALNETCIRNCTAAELKQMHQPSASTNASLLPFYADSSGENLTTQSFDDEMYEDGFNATCCFKNVTVHIVPTNLAKNKTYQTIIAWYSALMFGLIPLVLIATFNCFLVHAVYKSQRTRRKMTTSQENVSLSNENRITVMLIGVVILFLICQTPTASFLIYWNFYEPTNPDADNIFHALGNIFNFLLTVNASCNFIMYCVLSRRYRTTFRALFCKRRVNRKDTSLLSTKSVNSHGNSSYKSRRNGSEYNTPRNLETQSLTSIPRSKSLMMRQPGKSKSSDLII